jgi:hypothetical protein
MVSSSDPPDAPAQTAVSRSPTKPGLPGPLVDVPGVETEVMIAVSARLKNPDLLSPVPADPGEAITRRCVAGKSSVRLRRRVEKVIVLVFAVDYTKSSIFVAQSVIAWIRARIM